MIFFAIIPESACEGFFVKNRRCNTSSHLTSADLHLHTLASADLHLHTFTSADLHLRTFTSADLLSLLSISLLRRGRCRRRVRHEARVRVVVKLGLTS